MTTVKELIEFLQSQPQDLRVLISGYVTGYVDFDIKSISVADVFIGAGDGNGFGGIHEIAQGHVVYVWNKVTNQNEAYAYNLAHKDWERCVSFTDPNVLPSYGGEWAWSNGGNRWVRISPPETPKPDCIPWPIEKALLLSP